MSDTVDNVMDAVEESEPSVNMDDVVVSEETETVEEAPAEEVEEPEPVAEEVPVEEEPEPVASASETEAAEPAPSVPVSTQEVVQNVQEILSSTETNVSGNDLENRVKVLEERLESLISVLKDCSVRSIYEFI